MSACHVLLSYSSTHVFLPARSSFASKPLAGPMRSNAAGKDTTAELAAPYLGCYGQASHRYLANCCCWATELPQLQVSHLN